MKNKNRPRCSDAKGSFILTFYDLLAIMNIEKVLPIDGQPSISVKITAYRAKGRLFFCHLVNKANNRNDQ